MIRRFLASDFDFYTPQQSSEEKEQRNCYIPLNGLTGVSIEVRSASPCTVSAITADGESVFLEAGSVIKFTARLEGFSAVEIQGTDTFAYRCDANRFDEEVDPRRLVVALDEPASKPIDDLIREGIAKYLGKMKAQGILDDAELEELVDDVYNGDHEFEEEPDPFGLGHVEDDADPEEALEARRMAAAEQAAAAAKLEAERVAAAAAAKTGSSEPAPKQGEIPGV